MSEQYYPPGAFYFTVGVVGSGMVLATDLDASFQKVSGIQSERQVEEVAEGGENRFVYRLPRATRYSNLMLERGVVTKDSFLAEWAAVTLGSGLSVPIVPQNLVVQLLDERGLPLVVWGFVNAWPVRWEVTPMYSTGNDILTETLEFSYDYFQRLVTGSAYSAASLAGNLA